MAPIDDDNPFQLEGRLILVTGASTGIGRATAVTASRLGARVIANGRDEERLGETLTQLAGDGHVSAPCDLAETDALPGWVKQLADSYGPLDGLAHCAGIQMTRSVRQIDQAFFDAHMHVNLASALALARGIRQKGCRTKCAAICFVSSVAGYIGQPGNVAYAASKGGLISATQALAMEFVRDAIRVNCVAPALVDTEMTVRARRTLSQAQYDAILSLHPMGLGQPEDVANAIAFLLSDASRWITGTVLRVDGGYLSR